MGAVGWPAQQVLAIAEGLRLADNRVKARGFGDVPMVVYGDYRRWLAAQGETLADPPQDFGFPERWPLRPRRSCQPAPLPRCRLAYPDLRADLRRGQPLLREQHDPRPLDQAHRSGLRPHHALPGEGYSASRRAAMVGRGSARRELSLARDPNRRKLPG